MHILFLAFSEVITLLIAFSSTRIKTLALLPTIILILCTKVFFHDKLNMITINISCFVFELGILLNIYSGITKESSCLFNAAIFLAGLIAGLILYKLGNSKKNTTILVIAWGITILLFIIFFKKAPLINGSRNWINVGGVSIAIAEIYKLLYVIVFSMTAKIYSKSDNGLIQFYCYSCLSCIAFLILIKEGGTAMEIMYVTLIYGIYITYKNKERSHNFLTSTKSPIISAVLIAGLLSVGKKLLLFYCTHNEVSDRLMLISNRLNTTPLQVENAKERLLSSPILAFNLTTYERIRFGSHESTVTDFAFTNLCTIFGVLLPIIALLMLITCLIKCSFRRKDNYLAIGACLLWIVEILTHILGGLDIIPFAGVVLPLVSPGKSSLFIHAIFIMFISKKEE